MVWAIPRSLAATDGVSFDFLSCGYLDVSVPRVGFPFGMMRLCASGFPIRASPVHRLLASSPKLFAGSYALHRLLLPRHPPHALSSLISPKRSDAPFGALDVLRRRPRRRHLVYLPIPIRVVKDQRYGGDRGRTDDLLRAKQALSQLSYAPKRGGGLGVT